MADGAGGLAELDFASVTPGQFAELVKKLSARELRELGEDATLRARVLDEVFARMGRQFRPDAAGSLSAVIRWQITGANAAERVYETRIADRACTVQAGRTDAEPKVTLTLSDVEFLKLASGNASPITMFMTRKIKVVGDVSLAGRLNRYFDIPKA